MRKLALVLILAAAAVTGCGRDAEKKAGTPVSARDASKILEQTPWLDRAPEKEADIVHAYIFPRGEGVYFVGNAYKGAYEMFRYFVEGDELKLKFLDDGKTSSTKFKIERFDDRIFDYRLTLESSPRGPKVYYGFEGHHREAAPGPTKALIKALPR